MIKKLPYKEFTESFKNVPRIAINLLIKNGNGKILLTKRKKEPFSGYWHFPGSFLLKNEKLKDCIKRVAKEELGVNINPLNTKLLNIFEDINGDPRGHVIDIIYELKIRKLEKLNPTGDTKAIMFFNKPPRKIGFNHKKILMFFSSK